MFHKIKTHFLRKLLTFFFLMIFCCTHQALAQDTMHHKKAVTKHTHKKHPKHTKHHTKKKHPKNHAQLRDPVTTEPGEVSSAKPLNHDLAVVNLTTVKSN